MLVFSRFNRLEMFMISSSWNYNNKIKDGFIKTCDNLDEDVLVGVNDNHKYKYVGNYIEDDSKDVDESV